MGVARKAPWGPSESQSASLPYQKPRRIWAGRGSGVLCDLCRRPIEAGQIEYEVELAETARVPVLNLHLDCYEQWTALGSQSA